jgi:hypothetical protein
VSSAGVGKQIIGASLPENLHRISQISFSRICGHELPAKATGCAIQEGLKPQKCRIIYNREKKAARMRSAVSHDTAPLNSYVSSTQMSVES